MITMITLSRIPEFQPVREELRHFLAEYSPGIARVMLRDDEWEYEGKSEVADWILSATDDVMRKNRLECLELVIQEWERVEIGADSQKNSPQ